MFERIASRAGEAVALTLRRRSLHVGTFHGVADDKTSRIASAESEQPL